MFSWTDVTLLCLVTNAGATHRVAAGCCALWNAAMIPACCAAL